MAQAIQILMGFLLGLVITTGNAWARDAATATDLSLREGPGTNYYRIAVIPAGEGVDMKGCRDGWCAVIWDGYRGYASQQGLVLTTAEMVEPEIWPIFPRYPYRAGHYPKADWYHDMPPYTAITPRFYRKRFFIMAQERNRYRYVPHIFRDGGAYGDGGPIADVDIQAVGAGLRSSYESTYRD
jgi:hypothetical protein